MYTTVVSLVLWYLPFRQSCDLCLHQSERSRDLVHPSCRRTALLQRPADSTQFHDQKQVAETHTKITCWSVEMFIWNRPMTSTCLNSTIWHTYMHAGGGGDNVHLTAIRRNSKMTYSADMTFAKRIRCGRNLCFHYSGHDTMCYRLIASPDSCTCTPDKKKSWTLAIDTIGHRAARITPFPGAW